MKWAIVWMVLAMFVSSCALLSDVGADARLDEQLTQVEKALEEERDVEARDALDLALAERPSGAQFDRASRLEREVARRELEPFEASFRELADALATRDDVLARRLIERVFARGPRGAALSRAEAFRAVVDGRSSTAAITLRLEHEPGEQAGEHRLVLVARQDLGTSVRIRCPGGALLYSCTSLNAQGIENRTQRRLLTDALADLELESGREVRVVLAGFSVPTQNALAVRARWDLDVLGGSVLRDGRELPANHVAPEGCELVRLDPRLPADPVEPDQFRAYVERGAPSTPALLERAVRIAPERRDEALQLALPRLRAAPLEELERLAPALRWLANLREPPVNAVEWREWIDALAERKTKPARPTLDLPLR